MIVKACLAPNPDGGLEPMVLLIVRSFGRLTGQTAPRIQHA